MVKANVHITSVADPDPAFQFDADPNFDSDADPDPNFHFDADSYPDTATNDRETNLRNQWPTAPPW